MRRTIVLGRIFHRAILLLHSCCGDGTSVAMAGVVVRRDDDDEGVWMMMVWVVVLIGSSVSCVYWIIS